jgi:NADH dehydrogenase/NADH:ubiquinone oxidoreductase subunit G
VIYQGSHGDRGAHRADVILPGAAWTEEPGIFVNTEGRPQMANRAGFPPGEARENWAILRALSAVLGQTLPFDSIAALRRRMVAEAPHLGRIDVLPENAWTPVAAGDGRGGDFTAARGEHYLANPIMRASEVLAELARLARDRAGQALAADVIYNLGADEIELPAGPFVIYQGSHGDRGAHRADVILPGAAWTEESGIFVNTEGRPQMAARAGFPPGDARENWAILRALSAVLGSQLPFDTLAALRARVVAEVPHLGRLDEVPENQWAAVPPGEMGRDDFAAAGGEHYLVNPIARASAVMAELTRLAESRARPMAAE